MMTRKLTTTLLLVLTASLASCLKARETDSLIYDPARDEFRALMILENIQGDRSELDYLGKLMASKDNLLAPCIPGNAFGYAPWFLRLDDHQAATVHFSQPTAGDMQPIKVTGSLAKIDVRPGTFFVQGNRLCYYHALTIPGK